MARAAGWVTAVALGVVTGFVCRGLLEATSDPEPPVAPGEQGVASSAPVAAFHPAVTQSSGEGDTGDRLRREIERLHAELATEVALREELRGELEQVRRQLAAAGWTDSHAETDPARGERRAAGRGELAHLQWLDEARLLEAGLHPADIEALRERFGEIEMERLYLRDEATRDGWLHTGRYRKALREIDLSLDALRGEFGDEAYDWLLYASGRENRVLVGGVIENSPAGEAGLQSGDLVFSYDGVRIFKGEELRRATSQGEAGRLVELALDRGGERVRVYVPRGPLGIRLGSQRAKPQARR